MATYYTNGMLAGPRASRFQDWANLILAVWLFISPWVLQFGAGSGAAGGAPGSVSTAAWNAWVMGVLVFLAALSAVSRIEMWQEWLMLIFGVWIFIAPWALGFTQLTAASWDHWIVGALVVLFALAGMSTARTRVGTAGDINAPPRNPLP
jgi:hypothetical protein